MAIFVVFVPPSMKATELEVLRESLSIDIGAVREAYGNPFNLVTGDFNHKDVGGAINEVGEFEKLFTAPTRGPSTIDLIYSNTDNQVLPPLQSTTGVPRDHRCVYTEAVFLAARGYKWVTLMSKTRDQKREESFSRELTE